MRLRSLPSAPRPHPFLPLVRSSQSTPASSAAYRKSSKARSRGRSPLHPLSRNSGPDLDATKNPETLHLQSARYPTRDKISPAALAPPSKRTVRLDYLGLRQ